MGRDRSGCDKAEPSLRHKGHRRLGRAMVLDCAVIDRSQAYAPTTRLQVRHVVIRCDVYELTAPREFSHRHSMGLATASAGSSGTIHNRYAYNPWATLLPAVRCAPFGTPSGMLDPCWTEAPGYTKWASGTTIPVSAGSRSRTSWVADMPMLTGTRSTRPIRAGSMQTPFRILGNAPGKEIGCAEGGAL